jgi:DHA1 family tetracycline resistance protein-like MFS transporter
MLGATVGIPLLNTMLTARTPAELRGKMMGTTSSMSSWGRVIGPLLSGFMLMLFGYTGAWIAVMLVAIIYLSWAVNQQLIFMRSKSRDAQKPY